MESVPARLWQRVWRTGIRWRDRLDPDLRRWDRGFGDLRAAFYERLWTEAAARLGGHVQSVGSGYLRVSRGRARTYVRNYYVQLDDPVTLALAGDKPVATRLLAELGLPTLPFVEFGLGELDHAEAFRMRHGARVVVKPASGTGGGHGVTTGIDSPKALRQAAYRASAWARSLLVEPEVAGHSYRLLYLEGRLLDVVRRDPPSVRGDGRSTVRRLMRDETERRLVTHPVSALSPLVVDADCRNRLRRDGSSPASVPADGQTIEVKTVVNQNAAAQNHRLPSVDDSVVELGRRIVETLGVAFAGVDLIAEDVTSPGAASGVVVNEVNTTPGLHHHVLVSQRSEPPAVIDALLEHLLERGSA